MNLASFLKTDYLILKRIDFLENHLGESNDLTELLSKLPLSQGVLFPNSMSYADLFDWAEDKTSVYRNHKLHKSTQYLSGIPINALKDTIVFGIGIPYHEYEGKLTYGLHPYIILGKDAKDLYNIFKEATSNDLLLFGYYY